MKLIKYKENLYKFDPLIKIWKIVHGDIDERYYDHINIYNDKICFSNGLVFKNKKLEEVKKEDHIIFRTKYPLIPKNIIMKKFQNYMNRFEKHYNNDLLQHFSKLILNILVKYNERKLYIIDNSMMYIGNIIIKMFEEYYDSYNDDIIITCLHPRFIIGIVNNINDIKKYKKIYETNNKIMILLIDSLNFNYNNIYIPRHNKCIILKTTGKNKMKYNLSDLSILMTASLYSINCV